MNDTRNKIYDYLVTRFEIAPFPESQLPVFLLESEKSNMVNSYINDSYHHSITDVTFDIYQIIETNQSKPYFEDKVGFFPLTTLENQTQELILIFLDQNTPYYWTNSGLLFLEISQFIGVTEKDIQENSDRNLEYQANLIHLHEYRQSLEKQS